MPGFQVYQRSRRPRPPSVTIQRRGWLALNEPAFQAMDTPPFVELLYDLDERTIGLRPLAHPLPHAYPVRKRGRGSFLVAGFAFLKRYRIPHQASTRYVAEMVDGVLQVDLSRPGDEVTRRRS